MLRLPQTPNQKLCETNLVQTSYRIRYKAMEGYLLLSQNDIRVIVERLGTYTKAVELCYEHIAVITSESPRQLTLIDKKDRVFHLVSRSSTTAYSMEEDLKGRIAPLDYPWHG